MLVVGSLAVLSWQSMFPDRMDVHVLGAAASAAEDAARREGRGDGHGAAGGGRRAEPRGRRGLAVGIEHPRRRSRLFPRSSRIGRCRRLVSAELQAVLDRDLGGSASRSGLLAPGAGGGFAIGVSSLAANGACSPTARRSRIRCSKPDR